MKLKYSTNTFDLFEFKYVKELSKLNYCTFKLIDESAILSEDLEVSIEFNDGTPFMDGIIAEIERDPNSGLSKVKVYELMYELSKYYINDGSTPPGFEVSYSSTSLRSLISDILSTGEPSGWNIDTTSHSPPDDAIDYVSFDHVSKLSGIMYIVQDNYNYFLFCDPTSRSLYWGSYRDDKTSTFISYTDKEEKVSSIARKYDHIIVFGSSKNVKGESGNISSNKLLVLKLDEINSSEEAQRVADSLYSRLSSAKSISKITLDPTKEYMQLYDGDLITVDSNTYTIHKITGDELGKIVIELNDKDWSSVDAILQKLKIYKGSVSVGLTESQLNGGWQNFGSTVDAVYSFTTPSGTISSLIVDLKFDYYKKDLTTGGSTTNNFVIDTQNPPAYQGADITSETTFTITNSWNTIKTITIPADALAAFVFLRVGGRTEYNEAVYARAVVGGTYYPDVDGDVSLISPIWTSSELVKHDHIISSSDIKHRHYTTVIGGSSSNQVYLTSDSKFASQAGPKDVYSSYALSSSITTSEASLSGSPVDFEVLFPIVIEGSNASKTVNIQVKCASNPTPISYSYFKLTVYYIGAHDHNKFESNHTHPETADLTNTGTFPINVTVTLDDGTTSTDVYTGSVNAGDVVNLNLTSYVTTDTSYDLIVSSDSPGSCYMSGKILSEPV